jgi:hypothetical protein
MVGARERPPGPVADRDGDDAKQDRERVRHVVAAGRKEAKRVRRQTDDHRAGDHQDVEAQDDAEPLPL